MASVSRTAGAGGSITLETRNTAGQLIVPLAPPVVKWYTDAARTQGELTLPVTGSASTYTATWTAAQAPATAANRYIKATIQVSETATDTDADDDISFVDVGTVLDGGNTDVLTLQEARAALNLGRDTSVDNELAQVISAASQMLDNWVGAVVRRTITDEEHYGTTFSIILDVYPVASVTTVTEYTSGTPTALTAESLTTAGTYAFDSGTGKLFRRNSWAPATFAAGVRVSYVAGRFVDTESVDAAYKEAATKILMHLWQTRGAQSGAATFGGEGAPFGGVPYSTATLKAHVMAAFSTGPVCA